MFHDILH
jgi:serum/glucocorticoid-regulated kinase 2